MAIAKREGLRDLDADSLYSGEFMVATVQADYSLSASEHVILKNGWVSAYSWALNVGFATFGYLLSVLPKFIAHLENESNPPLSSGEWWTLGAGVGLVVVLFLIGCVCKNEKKDLLKAIDEHFRTAPKVRRRVEG